MPTIVAVSPPAGLVEELTRAAGELRVERRDDPDDLVHAVGRNAGDVVTVVLGDDVEDQVGLARRLHQQRPHLPVLLLAPEEHADALRATLRITPLIGRETRCLDPGLGPATWAAAAAEAADRELRRRSHARLMETVRTMSPVAPPTTEPSQYLGQLLEHAPIGVLTIDEDGIIRGWNPSATAIFGRREQDAVGTSFLSLFPSEEQSALLAMWQDAVGGDEGIRTVASRIRPDEAVQHVELVAAAVDADIPSLGCLVLIQDVTERQQATDELAERARHASLSAAVGLALTAPGPLVGKLQRCTEAIVEHLGAAFARVWLTEPPGVDLVLQASAGLYTHLDGEHSRVPVGQLKIGRIAATRQPHLTNDVLHDHQISDRAWAAREKMQAFAGYPLVIDDEVVGVMALFARHVLSGASMQALAPVADALAVAIEQDRSERRVMELLALEHEARSQAEEAARRYAHLAQTLQQSLLPPALPAVDGLDLAAVYHWSGDGSVIGGDFYDVFRLADGRWCAVIGDVTGKGVEAAAISALARYTLRAAALRGASPVELLSTLNRALLESETQERFCTVAVVAAGPGKDIASVVLAGHPPPAVVRADGSVELVGEAAPPAGLFPDVAYSGTEVRLPSGDCIVLYTDGVTEARSPDGRFHPSLLLDTLVSRGTGDAGEIIHRLAEVVLQLQDGSPRDDLAILGLRQLR